MKLIIALSLDETESQKVVEVTTDSGTQSMNVEAAQVVVDIGDNTGFILYSVEYAEKFIKDRVAAEKDIIPRETADKIQLLERRVTEESTRADKAEKALKDITPET